MVAVTPLMMVVMIEEEAEILEELMILVEEATPLTVEVRVLTADARSLLFTKLAVVVAVLPLTMEVRTKELVEVEMVRVLEVDDATRLVKSVEVATPLMVVVRTVPKVEISFEEMTVVVATTPLTVEVRMFPVTLWVKELMILAKVEEIPLTMSSM